MSKTTKLKIFMFCIILIFDILLLPWLLRFPEFVLVCGIGPSARQWFKSSPFTAVQMLFSNSLLRTVWLWMQLFIFVIIIGLFWNPLKIKRNYIYKIGYGGPPAAGNGQHGSARWLTEKEIDNTCTVWYVRQNSKLSLNKGGIVLGMKKKFLWNYKVWLETNDSHTLIIGTTRSGKSRRLYLPTIWELAKAGESMIITDPKGELYEKCCSYLKKSENYNVVLLDFRNPRRGNHWNPMDQVVCAIEEGNFSLASESAWDISHNIIHSKPHTGDPLWVNGPESVLTAIILNTALEAPERKFKNMTSAYYTLAELGVTNEAGITPLNEYFNSLPNQHLARAAFATAAVAPYKTRASFFTTVLSELRLWSDPSIGDMTSFQDHNLDDVGKEKTAVFLVIPDEKSTRHVLATLYIDQTYQALVALASKNNQRLPVRVNFLLDEFGNLPVIPDFPTKLTVAGGRGMRFFLAVQGLSQLKEKYKDLAETIKGNCHTWIYLITADVQTQKEISERLGYYTVYTHSSSATVTEKNFSSGYNEGLTGRPLLYPSELGEFPLDESLILRIRHKPARLPLPDLSEWPCSSELIGGECESGREIEEVPVWVPNFSISNIFNVQGDDKNQNQEDVVDSKNYIADLE